MIINMVKLIGKQNIVFDVEFIDMLTIEKKNVTIREHFKTYRIFRRTRASNNRYVSSKLNNLLIISEEKIKKHDINIYSKMEIPKGMKNFFQNIANNRDSIKKIFVSIHIITLFVYIMNGIFIN